MNIDPSTVPPAETSRELQQLEILMQAHFSPYTYSEIPSGATVIRLLCLDPGFPSEPLTAILRFAPLSKSTRYEAVSYAWGDPTKTHSIEINGRQLLITKPLYEVLCRLRLQDKQRMLWADAICINQNDDKEKSHQITLMADIYSIATCVLCWLGLDNTRGEGATAMRILQKLSAAGPLTDLANIRPWVIAEGLPKYGDQQWNSLDFFFNLSWFQRRWIIQEFVKGTEVRLLCGPTESDWTTIAVGVQRCSDYGLVWWAFDDDVKRAEEHLTAARGIAALNILLKLKTGAGTYSEFTDQIRQVYEGRGAYYEGENQWGAEWVNFIRSMHPETMKVFYQSLVNIDKAARSGALPGLAFDMQVDRKLSLCNLLAMCKSSHSSDPRDCVFALLGLAEEGGHPALKPDYTESVESVFIRYARYLIEAGPSSTSMTLITLAGIGRNVNGDSNLTLPSWVPNWSDTDMFGPTPLLVLQGLGTSLYRASGDTNLEIRFSDDGPQRLYLKGSVISTVKRIIPSPHSQLKMGLLTPEPERSIAVRSYFSEIDKLVLNRDRPYPYLASPSSYVHAPGSSEHNLEIVWRTLIGNAIDGANIRGAESEASFLDFRMMLGLPMTNTQLFQTVLRNKGAATVAGVNDTESWMAQWGKGMTFYSFAELNNGLFGLIPTKSQVGDDIFIPLGCGAPLVLRRMQDAKEKDSFELVGASYVHGVMDGEALGSHSWGEQDVCLV